MKKIYVLLSLLFAAFIIVSPGTFAIENNEVRYVDFELITFDNGYFWFMSDLYDDLLTSIEFDEPVHETGSEGGAPYDRLIYNAINYEGVKLNDVDVTYTNNLLYTYNNINSSSFLSFSMEIPGSLNPTSTSFFFDNNGRFRGNGNWAADFDVGDVITISYLYTPPPPPEFYEVFKDLIDYIYNPVAQTLSSVFDISDVPVSVGFGQVTWFTLPLDNLLYTIVTIWIYMIIMLGIYTFFKWLLNLFFRMF